MRAGLIYATLAFTSWGLYPLYFPFVASVSAFEIVLQRSAWALVFVLALLAAGRRWAWLADVLRQPRKLALFGGTALLLAGNWLVYAVAMQTGHIVDASLGYFVNPLINVLLGVLLLGERLARVQWAAVALAAAGVAWLTWLKGGLPWISLVLACSFAIYGLLRKTAPLGALEGLALENLVLAPLVLPLLAWWTVAQNGALAQASPGLVFWLVLSGPFTALPLLWFAAAARRLPLATLGMVQYLSPTLQLILGVWVFHEPFDPPRLLGFALIWAALALLSADALRRSLRPADPPP
jgi:chloramphenicol-sensitive protein RarD